MSAKWQYVCYPYSITSDIFQLYVGGNPVYLNLSELCVRLPYLTLYDATLTLRLIQFLMFYLITSYNKTQ